MNKLTPEEKILKESLENFHIPVSPKGWDKIESQIPKKRNGYIISISAIIVLVLAISIYSLTNKEEQNKKISELQAKEIITPKTDKKETKENNEKTKNNKQLKKHKKEHKNNIQEIITPTSTVINKKSPVSKSTNSTNTEKNTSFATQESNNNDFDVEIFASNYELCVNESIEFICNVSSNKIKTIIWDFGDGEYSQKVSPKHKYTNEGEYTVKLSITLIDNTKTQSELNKKIIVKKTPKVDFDITKAKEVFNPKIIFSSNSEKTNKYQWILDNRTISTKNNFEYSIFEKGVHKIELICSNELGCSSSLSKDLNVNIDASLPNVFSPNNDGQNDTWLPIIISSNDYKFELSIMTRNGKLAYKTNNKNNPWNGKILNSNSIASPGEVYIWIANIETDNTIKQIGGTITVL